MGRKCIGDTQAKRLAPLIHGENILNILKFFSRRPDLVPNLILTEVTF